MIEKNLIYLLDSCTYFDFDVMPEICTALSLQFICEGDIRTLCSETFVVDIFKNTVSVLFVDEKWNKKLAYLKDYFETCLVQRDFVLFFVLLRYFMGCENTKKSLILDNEEEYYKTVKPIKLSTNKCGKKMLSRHGLFFCECIFHLPTPAMSLQNNLNTNIFTHGENTELKNDFFEIKKQSFYYKNNRNKEMSYLLKKGFAPEEVFDFFNIEY